MLYLHNTSALDGKKLIDDIYEWDVVVWSKAMPMFQEAMRPGGLALEIGGRRGGFSLFAATMGYHVVCSDVINPESEASELIQSYGYQDYVTYEAKSANSLEEIERYDLILFKSVLGAVGQNDRFDLQQDAIQRMIRALKPGGVLLFSENMEATRLHSFFRKRFTKWGGRWRYLKFSEINALLPEVHAVQYHGFLATFGRTEKQRRRLGVLDRVVFDRITPASWRYVVSVVYKKSL